MRKRISYIYTHAENTDELEAELRLLMAKNPSCEIFISDKTSTPEGRIILEKLANDHSQIHII